MSAAEREAKFQAELRSRIVGHLKQEPYYGSGWLHRIAEHINSFPDIFQADDEDIQTAAECLAEKGIVRLAPRRSSGNPLDRRIEMTYVEWNVGSRR